MTSLPLLVVEDDRDLRDALCITLELAGYNVIAATDGSAALAILARQRVSLVISDMQMQPLDGFGLLREMRLLHAHVPVILMTAFGDIEDAVTAMRGGASDYLAKPFEPEKLLQLVRRYRLNSIDANNFGFICEDPNSSALLALAARVAAATTTTVLLTGERGSGRQALARYIHARSPRATGSFVSINCTSIREKQFESALFEPSQGGTLLLNEVADIPLSEQARLLCALQDCDGQRVIATTDRDLGACVAAGTFRADLFYQLNVFPLQILPLRERTADIVPLARHFVSRHTQALGRATLRLTAAAEKHLLTHAWPGNVRELENVLQRAVILASGEVIAAAELDFGAPPLVPGWQTLHQGQTESSLPGVAMNMKSIERAHIMRTLTAVNGSRKLAVERLGISERSLRYKLQQYRSEAIN
jgi:two-component system response regulator FlrC